MLEWLRLTRASGLFTLASNMMAAVAVAVYPKNLDAKILGEQLLSHAQALVWVAVSSCLIYMAGMAWNGILDLDRDRVLHPQRPLPTGRIAVPTAWTGAILLSSGALLAAAPLGFRGMCGAGVVLSLALLYNFVTKGVPYLGSLTMGAVRFAYAIFALLAVRPEYFDRSVLTLVAWCTGQDLGARAQWPIYPLIIGTYVFGLTIISELESRHGRRIELFIGGLIIAVALAAACWRLVTAHWLQDPYDRSLVFYLYLAAGFFAILFLILVWRLGSRWYRTVVAGRKNLVPPVVAAGLGGMILFDAVIAASGHPLVGVAVALTMLPFAVASAVIRMD